MRSSDSLSPPTLAWRRQAWCALGAPSDPRALRFGRVAASAQKFVLCAADHSVLRYLLPGLLYPSDPFPSKAKHTLDPYLVPT